MSNILVTLTKVDAPLVPGQTYAGTKVDVTDASGAVQTKTLIGSESPKFSATFTVVDGTGSVTATDLDVTGATIGTPVVQAFATGGTGTTFPQTTGVVVSAA